MYKQAMALPVAWLSDGSGFSLWGFVVQHHFSFLIVNKWARADVKHQSEVVKNLVACTAVIRQHISRITKFLSHSSVILTQFQKAPSLRSSDDEETVLSWQEYNSSVVFLLEGDMFPVAPFSPLSFLQGYGIAGTQQGFRHAKTGFLLRYLWVGFLLMDLEVLPNK